MSVLAAEDVDAIAEAVASRVLDLLADRQPPASGLVDAATLAHELGVTRSFVYQHADELGGIRLGSGSKPRLRFNVAQAKAAHRAKPTPGDVPETPPRRRRKPASGGPTVLKSRPRQTPGHTNQMTHERTQ